MCICMYGSFYGPFEGFQCEVRASGWKNKRKWAVSMSGLVFK